MFTPGYSERGGLEQRSRLLATSLAARGWDVRVLARATSRARPRLTRSPNLTLVEVPGFGIDRLGTLLFLGVACTVGLVWGARASALVAIKLFSSSTAAALCSAALGLPYIAMATSSGESSEVTYLLGKEYSGGEPAEARLRMAHRVGLAVRRRLLRRAAYVVAQTDQAADELAGVVPAERITVIPNPVVEVEVPPLTGARRALFTGRFSRSKDLFGLLEAWRTVLATHPDATLTLVGSGGAYQSVEEELYAAVAHDALLSRTVELTGWVSDVGAYLGSSDVFVFPSLTEGMSNALLEACAWGRVIVASDIEANRAVLGEEYPLVFPAGDRGAMAATLLRAFDDADVRADAVDKVTQRLRMFSTDRVVTSVEQLIERASVRRRRPMSDASDAAECSRRPIRSPGPHA